MSATILPFARPSATLATEKLPTKTRDTLLEAISNVVITDYAYLPWAIIEEALRAASDALDAGGMFLDAIVACDQVLLTSRPGQHGNNHRLLEAIAKRRERRQQAFFNLAARIIDARLQDHSEHKHYALLRARRVIEGGGTINAALYHALGDDYTGGAT